MSKRGKKDVTRNEESSEMQGKRIRATTVKGKIKNTFVLLVTVLRCTEKKYVTIIFDLDFFSFHFK